MQLYSIHIYAYSICILYYATIQLHTILCNYTAYIYMQLYSIHPTPSPVPSSWRDIAPFYELTSPLTSPKIFAFAGRDGVNREMAGTVPPPIITSIWAPMLLSQAWKQPQFLGGQSSFIHLPLERPIPHQKLSKRSSCQRCRWKRGAQPFRL